MVVGAWQIEAFTLTATTVQFVLNLSTAAPYSTIITPFGSYFVETDSQRFWTSIYNQMQFLGTNAFWSAPYTGDGLTGSFLFRSTVIAQVPVIKVHDVDPVRV